MRLVGGNNYPMRLIGPARGELQLPQPALIYEIKHDILAARSRSKMK